MNICFDEENEKGSSDKGKTVGGNRQPETYQTNPKEKKPDGESEILLEK